MEGVDVEFAHLAHRAVLFRSSFEDLVVDVGKVLHEGHLEAPPDQEAPQHIPVDVTAGMAQVAEVVDRHPTAVNADLARRWRSKWLSAAGEGVGKPQGHSCSEAAAEATSSLARTISPLSNRLQPRIHPPTL